MFIVWIVCKDNIVYSIHRIIMFIHWISLQDVAYVSYLIFSFYTARYPNSRHFGGSRQSRTFVNIDPPPFEREGRTRSANVCLRFLEVLMRCANKRPFVNYIYFSIVLDVSHMTKRILNHVILASHKYSIYKYNIWSIITLSIRTRWQI